MYDTGVEAGVEGKYADDADDDGEKKLVLLGSVTGTGGGSIVISLAAALSCAALMMLARGTAVLVSLAVAPGVVDGRGSGICPGQLLLVEDDPIAEDDSDEGVVTVMVLACG